MYLRVGNFRIALIWDWASMVLGRQFSWVHSPCKVKWQDAQSERVGHCSCVGPLLLIYSLGV